MKKILLMLAIVIGNYCVYAQTNTFPSSGNVGIGTTSPNTSLDVAGNLTLRPTTGISSNGVATITTLSTSPYHTDLSIIPFETDGYSAAGSSVIIKGSSKQAWYGVGGTVTIGGGLNRNAINNPNGYAPVLLQPDGGGVGIGTTDTKGYTLAINGSAIATSMIVKLYANWPDYVFKKDYKLPSLTEVKSYIDKNKHLPDMPSEQEVAKDGINLGEIVKLQTKKIEELTLYLIEKDKQLSDQSKKLSDQQKISSSLQDQINALSKKMGQ